jgi:TonB family protein
MRCFALRLAIALLTFVVGVTVAALWYSGSTDGLEKVVTPPPPPRLVAAPSQDEPSSPPQRACSWAKPESRTVEGGILNGRVIDKPSPSYPPIAKAARAQGIVIVRVVADECGNVISAQAVSGHPLLQQAAVQAARQARLAPVLLRGESVKVSGTLTYNFVLE